MSSQSPEDRDREKESVKSSLKAWWSNFTKASKLSGGSSVSASSPVSSNAGGGGGALNRILSGPSNERRSTTGAAASSASNDRVFGVPLRKSLKYASVAISMAGDDGKQYVWGYVPIIVAKTGLFLKESATDVEGVFRIAGSQKRMRQLQEVFDTPPKYGKHLTWEKYSVHDGASVLRRYLNQMPEPIVPLQLYNEFRNVMIKRPKVDVDAAVKTYRLLIASMPPANRYLLLYVLDLLAVFARKGNVNLMPASNLAVIFQPGIFSHPSHLQDADEHKVAIEVLQFLIEHQDHFVLAISPPPPTNVGPSDLTSVSQPIDEGATPNLKDVAELSDSDEEFGVLTVHEGGGAKLARRSTTNEDRTKRKGFFRSRKSATPSPRPPSSAGQDGESPAAGWDKDALSTTADGAAKEEEGEGVIEDLGEGKKRIPGSPQGDIHEVGITSGDANDKARVPITTVGVRRSKTVPSRRNREQEGQRSVSAGLQGQQPGLLAPGVGEAKAASPSAAPVSDTKEGQTKNALASIGESSTDPTPALVPAFADDVGSNSAEASAESGAEAKEVQTSEPLLPSKPSTPPVVPDLPTPPSSKVLDNNPAVETDLPAGARG